MPCPYQLVTYLARVFLIHTILPGAAQPMFCSHAPVRDVSDSICYLRLAYHNDAAIATDCRRKARSEDPTRSIAPSSGTFEVYHSVGAAATGLS